MSILKVQINHTDNISKEYLASHLYDEIGEEYDIADYEIEDYFSIDYVFKLPDNSYTTVFTIDFPNLELRDQEPKDIVKSYLDTLNSLDEIISVVKLQDEILQEVALRYYEKLFAIEMELRNVLTYILTYDEKPISNGIFKEFGIRIAESYSEENVLREYENGLYYILFNHYASFTEPQKLKAEKVSELLQSNHIQTFDDFNREIEKRFISEQRHIDFLFSIKQKLKPLEKMRNAIMHIRNLSKTMIKNFDEAIQDGHQGKGIQTLIDEFWQEENNEIKEITWLSLAKKELPKYTVRVNGEGFLIDYVISEEVTLTDDQNEFESIEEANEQILEEIKDKIEVTDFEPTDENIEELRNELNGTE